MDLFDIASNLENIRSQVNKAYDLISICEEGLAECAEALRDGDGLAKYIARRIDRQMTLVEVISTEIGTTAKDLLDEAYRIYKIHWEGKEKQ